MGSCFLILVMLMAEVTVFEVGPRDGLQNEAVFIDTEIKVALIDMLSKSGLQKIEATSFVSPKWVPQLADGSIVMNSIERVENVIYSALTPNERGMRAALDANVDEVAIFAAASESFSQKNINCSIEESLARFTPIMELARKNNIPVRGYVSCVTHCPYDGQIAPSQTIKVSNQLLEMGCYEISLGDTIGKAEPVDIRKLLDALKGIVSMDKIALHCHDTYGHALDNIKMGLDLGVRTFDSAVGGLGGCPYAEGASGNVSTEEVVSLLTKLGIESGINSSKLEHAANFIKKEISKTKNQ